MSRVTVQRAAFPGRVGMVMRTIVVVVVPGRAHRQKPPYDPSRGDGL